MGPPLGRVDGKFRDYCDLFLEESGFSPYNGETAGEPDVERGGAAVFFLQRKRMKTMTSAFLTNDRRFLRRRGSASAVVRLGVGAALVAFSTTGFEASAQNVESTPSEGRALFVPTLDLQSPTSFSSVEAARSVRPPQPAKRREELIYPEGFLELSAPTPEPTPEAPLETERPSDEKTEKTEEAKKEEPPRRLDPSAETTPLAPPPQPEPPQPEPGDQILFFALSIALVALGGFIYADYRYRDRLKNELARNARLRSPNAVAADFDDVLSSVDGERLDASFDDLAYFSTAPSTSVLDDEEVFEPIAEPAPPTNGADLNEENFDFAPASDSNAKAALAEPQEDFVVGANPAR